VQDCKDTRKSSKKRENPTELSEEFQCPFPDPQGKKIYRYIQKRAKDSLALLVFNFRKEMSTAYA
jgi:hypothetical protein